MKWRRLEKKRRLRSGLAEAAGVSSAPSCRREPKARNDSIATGELSSTALGNSETNWWRSSHCLRHNLTDSVWLCQL
jgi:hypothetical protein